MNGHRGDNWEEDPYRNWARPFYLTTNSISLRCWLILETFCQEKRSSHSQYPDQRFDMYLVTLSMFESSRLTLHWYEYYYVLYTEL